jgi:hypothetical protein
MELSKVYQSLDASSTSTAAQRERGAAEKGAASKSGSGGGARDHGKSNVKSAGSSITQGAAPATTSSRVPHSHSSSPSEQMYNSYTNASTHLGDSYRFPDKGGDFAVYQAYALHQANTDYAGFSLVAPDLYSREGNQHLLMNEIGVQRFNEIMNYN